MPGKSIRFQFAVIGILYVFFALMLILEMFFVYKRAQNDINEMRQTHTTINEYLKLEDEELQLTYRIRNVIANPVNKNNTSELDKLDEDIGKWYAKIEFWKQKMATWQISEDSGSLENSVFSKTFMFNKKRQANAYKRAVQCCRENQSAEAQHIMNIESRFSHSVHNTILMINSKMELRQEKSIKTLRNFFLIMTVGCLFALALIIISGTGIYRNIIGSINKIDAADDVTVYAGAGDDYQRQREQASDGHDQEKVAQSLDAFLLSQFHFAVYHQYGVVHGMAEA
eukprot:TRINITY_DN4397_c0_g1_i6.p4 TRINITY_DN4397_c0_g1~~TRINITY_DN4397_c0_g1_i6.p4  ORF type:complete len:284 (-),score=61.64 TRINITY_DN4397_c0_g1_i6:2278-3129(-)